MEVNIIGDSFARRLSLFLNKPDSQLRPVATVGISGATISDLKLFLKQNRPVLNLNKPCILAIGNNDVLKRCSLEDTKSKFLSLRKLIRRMYGTIKLIILQLPIYPRISKDQSIIQVIKSINSFIATWADLNTKIIRLTVEFDQFNYFCKFFGKSSRRDGIHWNSLGQRELVRLVVRALSD